MKGEIIVCKMCLDLMDPITEDGIYVITESSDKVGIVVENGMEVTHKFYSKSYSTGEILDDLMEVEVV